MFLHHLFREVFRASVNISSLVSDIQYIPGSYGLVISVGFTKVCKHKSMLP